jgi:hypothetical protein
MFCSKCGTQIAEGVNFCSRCGSPVSTIAPSVSNAAKTGSKGWIWLLIVPVGIIILTIVVNTSSTTKQPTKSDVKPVERIASTGNVAHDQLMTHTQREQAFLLGQIAQEGCVGNRAFYMGMDKERDAYWSVGCTNGASYQVQIKPNATGSTRVLECSVLRAVAKINCFARLGDQ